MTLPGGTGVTTTTIDYNYDPLYRLTAADYSTGDYYHYNYDAVGNRLQQQTSVNSLQSTVKYEYDVANRLASVDNVNYTWDANGNLVNDGTNAYTYDPANRMSSVTQGNNRYAFNYNGLGDRLQQTVNGQATNYTLDLNAELTQVLDDGTNTYTYGLDRISQQHGSTAEYFLGDALGSVRQLTDASDAVTLSKSYDPYGNVIASAGSSTSIFAFTGEQGDQSGLTYLRARYYAPGDGRFTQIDPIQDGNTWYGYTQDNPVNFTDPSGNITQLEEKDADWIVEIMKEKYNIKIQKDWGLYYWHEFNFNPFNGKPFMTMVCEWRNGNWIKIRELRLTLIAVEKMAKKLGGPDKFKAAMKRHEVTIERVASRYVCGGGGCDIGSKVQLPDDAFSLHDGGDWAEGTVVHELAHAWDYWSGYRISSDMNLLTKSFKLTHKCNPRTPKSECQEVEVFDPIGSLEQPVSEYAITHNPLEDWADSVRKLIIHSYGEYPLLPIRRAYIEKTIQEIP